MINIKSYKIGILVFCILLIGSYKITSADDWGWGNTQGSNLTNYYCNEGIKFYEVEQYKEAKQAFKKALMIDSECETAKEYLNKMGNRYYKPVTKPEVKSKPIRYKEYTSKIETSSREEELKREIEKIEAEIRELENQEYEPTEQKVSYRKSEKYHYSEKQEKIIDIINDTISPLKVSGEYRMGLGIYPGGEVEWKKADADLQEDGWRYIYGEERFNTFDPVIYNRLKLNIETSDLDNWNLGMKLVVDPWSWTGKSETIRIYNKDKSDYADIQLKSWGNLDTTIPQTVRTHKGNVINIPEIRIKDGKIVSTSLKGAWSDEVGLGWSRDADFGIISDYPISSKFQPIRNLWTEYKTDDWKIRVFPLSGQEEALTSDDPLGLSNHHIYWEPSPWLDYWQAGVDYTKTGWETGEWAKDWYAEDSEHQWLRRLRGITLAFGNPNYNNLTLETTLASPLGVWDDYSEYNALPMALRLKYKLSNEWQIGTTQTARIGYDNEKKDAFAYAGGIDIQYSPTEFTTIRAEIAHSQSEENILTDTRIVEKDDEAYKIELATKIATLLPDYYDEDIPLDINLSYTHIGENFYAPLASYSYTCNDSAWGRYLSFFPRSYEDEAIRIGDSIDIDRETFGITLKSELFDNRLRPLFNYRNANRVSDGEFIESVFRSELEYDITDNLKSKIVHLYNDRPNDIKDRDTSSSRIAGGLRYKWTDWLTTEAIYTRTNEYPEFPQDIYTWLETKYPVNPIPPYPYYNIYKGRIIYQPYPEWSFTLDHTTNEFEFANRIADDYYYDELSYTGIEIAYKPTNRLTTRLVYRNSQVANLNDYIDSDGKDKNIENHHNVYGEVGYMINPDAYLTLQYGDLGVYTQGSYIPYTHAVLDTQHLFRIFYTQKF